MNDSYYFSFKTGIPVGIVVGGKLDGKYIRVAESGNMRKPTIIKPLDFVKDITNNSKFIKSEEDMMKLEDALIKRHRPSGIGLGRVYDQCIEKIDGTIGRSFVLPIGDKGRLQIIPNAVKNQTTVAYIAGPSGSGKSWYIKDFLKQYKTMFPKNKMYLFSRKGDDESLDSVKGLQRVKINKELLDFLNQTPQEGGADDDEEFDEVGNKIIKDSGRHYRRKVKEKFYSSDEEENSSDGGSGSEEGAGSKYDALDEFQNSCCIFDDIGTIPDIPIRNAVKKLQDDLQETGRSREITVINTSHDICAGHTTKKSIGESTFVVVFPKGGARNQIQYYLTSKQGLNPEQIARVMSLPTRGVCVYCRSPRFILYDGGCYFLD